MKQNNFSTTFAVVVNGADVNTKLDLKIPEMDLTFLIVKDNTATLYVRTKNEIGRKTFQKTGRYYSKIEKAGFTVGEVKTGTQADNAIRAIINSEGRVCSDEEALSKFKGEVKKREEAVMIDWTMHQYGRHEKKLKPKDVARDFSERLKSGSINDLYSYFEYLDSLDSALYIEIMK